MPHGRREGLELGFGFGIVDFFWDNERSSSYRGDVVILYGKCLDLLTVRLSVLTIIVICLAVSYIEKYVSKPARRNEGRRLDAG